jgi:hypothetical protein
MSEIKSDVADASKIVMKEISILTYEVLKTFLQILPSILHGISRLETGEVGKIEIMMSIKLMITRCHGQH